MSENHPVELAWRRFRRAHGDRLEAAEARLGDPARPLSLEEAGQADASLAESLAGWSAYRLGKCVLDVETGLAEALEQCPLPERTPTEALELPRNGCALRLGGEPPVLAWLEPAGAPHQLRFSRVTDQEQGLLEPLAALDLGLPTLQEALEAFQREQAPAEPPAPKGFAAFLRGLGSREGAAPPPPPPPPLGLFLKALLYALGNGEYRPGPAAPKGRNGQTTDKARRLQDLSEPQVQCLGPTWREALEEERREAGGQPLPRRNPSHLYWTGTEHRRPRVLFHPRPVQD